MIDRRLGSLTMVLAAGGTGIGLARLAPVLDPTMLPADPELAVTVAVWWGTVVTTLWWTSGVILWALSRRTASPMLIRLASVITPRSSRRAAEALLTLSLLSAGCSIDGDERAPAMRLIGPVDQVSSTELASTTTAPAPTTRVPTSTTNTTTPPPASTAPSATTATSSITSAPPGDARPDTPPADPSPPQQAASATDIASSHEVVGGDNLWTIAEAALAARTTEAPSRADVTAYWAQLIDLNRDRLRSGDPCLIHPGETIELPAAS